MIIILIIAFIVYAVKHTIEIKQQKELIIEKGVDEQFFYIYLIGIWFYLIPPLFLSFLYYIIKQPYMPPILAAIYLPILAAFYLPSVIAGLMIYKKFNRGFDYERRIGNKINLTLWIGYGAITLFIGMWLISIIIRLFK
jgi:hypothetical protein